jgi:hypothetical protein
MEPPTVWPALPSKGYRSRGGSGLRSDEAVAIGMTASKQIVQRPRLTPFVFLDGFERHASDHVAFLGKAPLPSFFVSQRFQNLGCDGILLIGGQSNDLFQCLLEERGHTLRYQRTHIDAMPALIHAF